MSVWRERRTKADRAQDEELNRIMLYPKQRKCKRGDSDGLFSRDSPRLHVPELLRKTEKHRRYRLLVLDHQQSCCASRTEQQRAQTGGINIQADGEHAGTVSPQKVFDLPVETIRTIVSK